MLQQESPQDYVIAAGEQHSVREFVELAAREIGIEVRWEGEGVNEKGYDAATGACIVEIDPRYFRPTEVETLLGDATKAREQLGWLPKTTFEELVTEMMREDLRSAQRDDLVKKHGYKHFNYKE
jgi:GDPmannose 4,6-dehydratase